MLGLLAPGRQQSGHGIRLPDRTVGNWTAGKQPSRRLMHGFYGSTVSKYSLIPQPNNPNLIFSQLFTGFSLWSIDFNNYVFGSTLIFNTEELSIQLLGATFHRRPWTGWQFTIIINEALGQPRPRTATNNPLIVNCHSWLRAWDREWVCLGGGVLCGIRPHDPTVNARRGGR